MLRATASLLKILNIELWYDSHVYLDTVRKTAFLLRETVYSWYNRACALCKPMWMQLRTQARSLSSQPITVMEFDFLLN